jgi:hypothetical protein
MPLTIAQLEEERFHHISCWCEPCRITVWVSFKMIRAKLRDNGSSLDIGNLTIAEMGKLMPCSRCGAHGTYKEVRQEDAPGYAKTFSW